jgi:NAD(P)H-dependent flavin oxidoreductase YrpB (nitropropane dioxygenase family)
LKTILLFVPDLFFSTKIEDAARRLGYKIESVSGADDFDMAIKEKDPALVLLTFERTGDTWQRLASAAVSAGVRVLAYGSHMNVNAFKRAKELGCDDVVANSRLSAELSSLLQKWVG